MSPVLIGVGATCLSVLFTALQLRKIFVDGDKGVSLSTWVIVAVANTGWVAWASVAGVWASAASSGICAPMAWVIVVKLAHVRPNGGTWMWAGAFGAGLLVGGTFVAAGVVAVFLSVIGPISNMPQVIRSVRGGDLSGVSVWGWTASLVSQGLWVLVGVFAGAWPVMLSAGTSVVQTLIVSMATTLHKRND